MAKGCVAWLNEDNTQLMKMNVLEQQSHNENSNLRMKAYKAIKGLEELVKMNHK